MKTVTKMGLWATLALGIGLVAVQAMACHGHCHRTPQQEYKPVEPTTTEAPRQDAVVWRHGYDRSKQVAGYLWNDRGPVA